MTAEMGTAEGHDEPPSDDGGALPVHVRRQRILERVNASTFVRVSDLSEAFNLSSVTIRSDLAALEKRGRIRRIRGGAIPRTLGEHEAPLDENVGANATEKAAIGAAAAARIENGQSLMLDAGSTTTAVAQALVDREELQDVTVFTNGLTVALALEPALPRIRTVVTGGSLRAMQHSLVEPLAMGMVDRLRVHTAIIGGNGAEPDAGFTTVSIEEADVKQKMLAAADARIFVLDGSKIGAASLYRVCEIDDADELITGESANPVSVESLRDAGLSVSVATGPTY